MYMDLLSGRTNPNGAEISVTFFISHEYNDYNLTHEIYRQGKYLNIESFSPTLNQLPMHIILKQFLV